MSDSAAPRPCILIADDSDVCRAVLTILLKNTGFEVTCVVNGREALAKLHEKAFDLALLDHDMPELDGLATLEELRAFAPDLPVVVVSGTLTADLRVRYEKHGVDAIYDKPVDPRKLRDRIPAIVERRKRMARDAALEKPAFSGDSAQVRRLTADFRRILGFHVAATMSGGRGAAFLDVAVALAEEKGVELLACRAEDVSEARLTKIFLAASQHKRPVLLTVLGAEKLTASQQELLDDWIGGGGELAAFNGRTRVILCTEASLTALADAGEFNEMLLIRAGTMKLAIPSLAQRREDLPWIARAVLRRIGAPSVKFTPEALDWLEKCAWPGDFMQLHRTVEIARRTHPETEELDVIDLQQAYGLESGWSKPLYHDVLLNTLGGE